MSKCNPRFILQHSERIAGSNSGLISPCFSLVWKLPFALRCEAVGKTARSAARPGRIAPRLRDRPPARASAVQAQGPALLLPGMRMELSGRAVRRRGDRRGWESAGRSRGPSPLRHLRGRPVSGIGGTGACEHGRRRRSLRTAGSQREWAWPRSSRRQNSSQARACLMNMPRLGSIPAARL